MTDFDDMAAGDDLDRLIWAQVMGRQPEDFPIGSGYSNDDHWAPSIDMADAWEVVEHLRALGWTVWVGCDFGAAWATQVKRKTNLHERTVADTAPLVICRAALKAIAG